MALYKKEDVLTWKSIGDLKKTKNVLCVFQPSDDDIEFYKNIPDLVFGAIYLCLGEIKHMAGHFIFATPDGKVVWGYHSKNFKAIPKEEV